VSDLNFDLQLLHQLRDDLDAVVNEFTNADEFSNDVATATGHDELGGHVSDFASKWNDKRKTMLESVKALQQKIGAITDGFTEVDDSLAKALNDAAASMPPMTATKVTP
jgi:hypothetical protein